MSESPASETSFKDLNLPAPLQAAIDELGYETPFPIQAQAIPYLMQGLDLIGRAPTGTGKTAAFALPLLARTDTELHKIQVMVLTPTRELAIQVAEAFQRYASHIRGFHVLPVYGGQEYGGQIRQLKRGVHVVVGTPGRVIDHMKKGTLRLDNLQAIVLDEADEMLKMGFIDDVEWVLEQTPDTRQVALFSATMPREIRSIAKRHLRNPEEVSIKAKTATAETIRQRFWPVSGLHKMDALTRILEVEPFDAMLIFVRTRVATTRVAERLEARGFSASALNGDMAQNQREQMITKLKKGSIDILVATDVAARGLDVDRISHVVNYDIPSGTEAYVHRIGRTGRAGRTGQAILFVSPRERRMLGAIEKATRQRMDRLELPTIEMVHNKRIADFKQRITDTLSEGELDFMQSLVDQYQQEHDIPAVEIAAALAKMAIGGDESRLRAAVRGEREERTPRSEPRRDYGESASRRDSKPRNKRDRSSQVSHGMKRYRIEVGYTHEVKPGNIVGAIANESGLDAAHIGHIDIHNEFSLIDLPKGMPNDVLKELKGVIVCGQRLRMSATDQEFSKGRGGAKSAARKKSTASRRSGGHSGSSGRKSSDGRKARKERRSRG